MRRYVIVLAIVVAGCRGNPSPTPTPGPTPTPTPIPTSIPTPIPTPTQLEELELPGDLTAYVLRGEHAHRERFLFIPGMCVHPLGYAQSFQWAAAARGELLTLQGDVGCGGPNRRWSGDLEAMSRRIDALFEAAGTPERDVTLIGYSQGAERAERLAARHPEVFTRVILIASPIVPQPSRLTHVRAAALMAGSHDAQANMREGVRLLQAAGIPAAFFEIPDARHGGMGTDPEATMAKVFDWLDAHARAH